MYPTDDRTLRVRLLISECHRIRQRLTVQLAASRELRARACRLCERAGAPVPEEGVPEPWDVREMG
jgi:hypothetical protein